MSERQIIVFDTETTGLLKPRAAGIESQPNIIEIYCVKIDESYNILGEFESYVKPPAPIPDFITGITKISNDMVADAPSFIDIVEDLDDFFYGSTEMVAHNLAYDKSMVGNEAVRAGKKSFNFPEIETCTVQKSMSLEQRRISLSRLHELLLGKGFKDAHRAKSDVMALVRCYHQMRERGMCE